MFVLLVAALVILGPERLPGAVAWTARGLRQVREYASGASRQLKEELGPEFEDLRKPLSELSQLRSMTPRGAITKHLLDGDDSFFTGDFDKPSGNGSSAGAASAAQGPSLPRLTKADPAAAGAAPPAPFDPDAT